MPLKFKVRNPAGSLSVQCIHLLHLSYKKSFRYVNRELDKGVKGSTRAKGDRSPAAVASRDEPRGGDRAPGAHTLDWMTSLRN